MSAADEIQKLAKLHKQGAITDEEFAEKKAQLLGFLPRTVEEKPSYSPEPVTVRAPIQPETPVKNIKESLYLFISQWKTIFKYRLAVTLFGVSSLLYILSPIDVSFAVFAMLLQFVTGTWALLVAFTNKPRLVYWPVPVFGFAFLFLGALITPTSSTKSDANQAETSAIKKESATPRQKAADNSPPGECALLAPDKAAVEAAIADGMTPIDAMAEAAKDPDAFIAKYSYATKGIQCTGDKVVNYGYSRGNFGGSAGQAMELHRLVLNNKKARTITMMYSLQETNSKIIYDRTQGTLQRINDTGGIKTVESWRSVKDEFIQASASKGNGFIDNGTYRFSK